MKHVVLYHRHTIVNAQPRPGCLHAALALALVILALACGYVAGQVGISAYLCNVVMLISAAYALGFVIFVECKRAIDMQLARSYA